MEGNWNEFGTPSYVYGMLMNAFVSQILTSCVNAELKTFITFCKHSTLKTFIKDKL
jgi:hypothetical protein